MTSNQNKFLVSQLVITFRLLLFLVFLLILFTIIPLTSARNARNTASSNSIAVNKTLNNNNSSNNIYNNNNNLTESLVIMSNGTNITSVYNSFIEFKKMFGVEFPDDRRIAFTSGDGKLDHLDWVTIKLILLPSCTALLFTYCLCTRSHIVRTYIERCKSNLCLLLSLLCYITCR